VGSNSKGMDEVIKTLPTARSTMSGIGLITGCFSKGVWQLAQIGIAPLGGCKTSAGPQQHEGQRYRAINLKEQLHIILKEFHEISTRLSPTGL